MKFIFKCIAGFVLVSSMLILVGVGYVAVRIHKHQNPLSDQHLAAKQAYLQDLASLPELSANQAPNVVIILFDDLGYGDLGAYGSKLIHTPAIDRVAANGLVATQGFSAAPYCTPSRAALLTGRYAGRMNFTQVVFPEQSAFDYFMRLQGAATKMPRDEITIAEILAARGYATQMVGKWHLGEGEGAEPNDFGFENYFGVLFSNDMAPFNLLHNRQVVEKHPVDQSTLTARYTDEAVRFIDRAGDRPLFLYFAHTFPHIPLYADPAFAKQSKAGLYGDVVEDLDRSVGAVVDALEKAGKLENTILIITSDNGPWYQGSAGPVRGRKNETFEGGMRVPLIIHWPAVVAPSKTDQLLSGLDILPTVLSVTQTPLPTDRVIDGQNLSGALAGEASPVREHLLLERAGVLEAIRTPTHKYRGDFPIYGGNTFAGGLAMAPQRGSMLFDLVNDPYESYDIADAEPELAAHLAETLEAAVGYWTSNRRGWIQD